MKVLVTGGAGFIGHHLIEHIFKNTDWDVVCLDRLDTSGDLNRIAEILDGHPEFKPRFKFVYHDLKAEINLHVAKEIGWPKKIFHLAASSHVERSIQDPLLFLRDNTIGTANLLQWARTVDKLDYIQCFSTDEVYGNALDGRAYSEDDRYKPRNPYAASKAAADQVAYAFHITYGLPIVTTNCMNVIGQRQHPEKFLPLCIKKILNQEKIFIHCYPGKNKAGTRFYVHARNVAAACLHLADWGTPGETYNLVGQKEVSNLELVQMVGEILGIEPEYEMVDFHSSRPGHDLRYALEPGKIETTGFEYPIPFDQSLRETVWWTVTNKRWL
jgi:dTDP-glucose 4,6-dehydratase